MLMFIINDIIKEKDIINGKDRKGYRGRVWSFYVHVLSYPEVLQSLLDLYKGFIVLIGFV